MLNGRYDKMNNNNIDLIGDIHGHATELVKPLQMLGYKIKNGLYSHYEQIVMFVCGYIDQKPQIKEMVQIVRYGKSRSATVNNLN